MSNLSRFMHAARAILDEQDRKTASNDRPPFFVRTTWLFAELEELGTSTEASIFASIKIARLGKDIAALGPLLELIDANTKAVACGRCRHERTQLVAWIREQITKEPADAR